MQYLRTAEHLMNDLETEWPGLTVTKLGGKTFWYDESLAKLAFDMFYAEDQGSRYRLRESSALSQELAAHALQLEGWSIDFAALERQEYYDRPGRLTPLGPKRYSFRMSVLPPLPPSLLVSPDSL